MSWVNSYFLRLEHKECLKIINQLLIKLRQIKDWREIKGWELNNIDSSSFCRVCFNAGLFLWTNFVTCLVSYILPGKIFAQFLKGRSWRSQKTWIFSPTYFVKEFSCWCTHLSLKVRNYYKIALTLDSHKKLTDSE